MPLTVSLSLFYLYIYFYPIAFSFYFYFFVNKAPSLYLLHLFLFFFNLIYFYFFFVRTNNIFISAQDLRVNRPWERWPAHLALPMILMRESMKKSMIQSLTTPTTNATPLDAACVAAALINKPRQSPKVTSPSNSDGGGNNTSNSSGGLGIGGGGGFDCSVCGRIYKLKSSLRNHQKWECGKEPQFKCPYCVYKAKQKMHMARHMERMHKEIDYSAVKNELGIKNESSEAE